MQHLDEEGEILAREAAYPAVEQAVDVVVVGEVEGEDKFGDLRHRPVHLEAVSGDAEAISGGDVVLAEAGYFRGDLVLASVVVHEAFLRFLECQLVRLLRA